jgi:uncharacterized protein YebE (UPF0316 family)
MEYEIILEAGGIFLLRVIGNMITTVRLVTLVRGQKLLSTFLAIFEALIFALAIGSVVNNLGNIWNLSAYCLGYAAGGYLGLVLEHRLIQRFVSIQVISAGRSDEIAMAVRRAGYGATETWGEGAQGKRGMVTIVVGHREVDHVTKIVQKADPDAFVMLEELRGISRGYFRLARPER